MLARCTAIPGSLFLRHCYVSPKSASQGLFVVWLLAGIDARMEAKSKGQQMPLPADVLLEVVEQKLTMTRVAQKTLVHRHQLRRKEMPALEEDISYVSLICTCWPQPL